MLCTVAVISPSSASPHPPPFQLLTNNATPQSMRYRPEVLDTPS